MRHTATFGYQFPVTAYVMSILLYNPSATADIEEEFFTAYREVLNNYRIVETLALDLHI